jgi:hypothetical protein
VWEVLYPKTDRPFDVFTTENIAGRGGAGQLKYLITQLVAIQRDKKIIALFDNDPEGVKEFQTLDLRKFIAKKTGLKIKKNENGFCAALLLPIPEGLSDAYENVEYFDAATGESKMNFFEIEDYFVKDELCKDKFSKMDKYQGEYGIEIPKMKEGKSDFSDFIGENKDGIDFEPMKILFEKIKTVFNSKS